MKRNLPFINEEKGIILPFVLLISALLFLFVSTSIAIYNNEIIIAKNEITQIKIDTLFQISREKFRESVPFLIHKQGIVRYNLPDGTVEINYILLPQDVYQLTFTISAENKKHVITNQMKK